MRCAFEESERVREVKVRVAIHWGIIFPLSLVFGHAVSLSLSFFLSSLSTYSTACTNFRWHCLVHNTAEKVLRRHSHHRKPN